MNYLQYCEQQLDDAETDRERFASTDSRRASWRADGRTEAWAEAISRYTNGSVEYVRRQSLIRRLQRKSTG